MSTKQQALFSIIPFPRLLLLALILFNFFYFGLYASRRHLAFETGAFDTGVYAQPLWNFIQGQGFAVSLIEDNGPLRWATHVEPILFFIAPIYALWPDPRTLFWLQIGALSLAALPLYALAARRLRQNEWAALIVTAAYFLLPAAQSVALFDFHAVTFAPLFLLSAIYFLDRALALQGKSFWMWPELKTAPLSLKPNLALTYTFSALFFLLALWTKEDISLIIFMIGAYLLFCRRRWQEGLALIIVGIGWFYLTFQVIIPAYRTGGGHSIYAAWFETLGNTPLEIALSPFTAPDKVLDLIFRPGSLPALAMITVPLALLPWFGLPVFALAAPSLAFVLLSQNATLRQLETWHYAAPMLPFIMLGTIDGLARISEGLARYNVAWLVYPVPRGFVLKALTLILLLTALTYSYFRGYGPLSQLSVWPEVTAHHQLGRQIAASIPAEASVLAQAQLIPHIAHREKLGIWSGPLLTDYDYIWLDLSHPKLPNRFGAHDDLLIGLIYEHAFGVVAHTDGYLLLKNGAKREVIGDDLFTFTQYEQLPAEAQPFSAIFGDEIKLVGVKTEIHRLATSETEPQVVLYFEALRQPAADYFLFLYRLDENGAVKGATDYAQPAIFWWPTSRWQAGDKRQVRVNTIPFWTGDTTTFAYAIGFSRTNSAWNQPGRLPVTLAADGLNPVGTQHLDQGTLLAVAAFERSPGWPVFRDFASWPYPKPLTILPPVESENYVAGNETNGAGNQE